MDNAATTLISRRYRSAIAVNNTSVRLLERQCYRQAVESLKDAAALMKAILFQSSCLPSSPDSVAPRLPVGEDGKEFVRRSLLSLARPQPTKTATMPLDVLTATQDGSVVAGQVPSNTTVSDTVLQFTPSFPVAFPVRIEDNLILGEPSALQEIECTPELTVQAAMIWNNLGIAYLCHSKTAKKNRRKLRRAALHFLRVSNAVLEKNYQTGLQYSTSFPAETACRTRGLPCLIIAVLCTLIHALHASFLHEKATQLYSSLDRLRTAASAMEVPGSDGAAPAA